jgi:hypothetical protein
MQGSVRQGKMAPYSLLFISWTFHKIECPNIGCFAFGSLAVAHASPETTPRQLELRNNPKSHVFWCQFLLNWRSTWFLKAVPFWGTKRDHIEHIDHLSEVSTNS